MTEQQLQAKIIKYLNAKGTYTIKVVTATKAGVPDIIACYRGKFLGIEVKIKPNKPSALQEHNIHLINTMAGWAIIAYKLEDVIQLLNQIDKLILECIQ